MSPEIEAKRRELFEAAYLKKFGFAADGEPHSNACWFGFNAGLDSLVIELPPTITAGDVYDAFGMDDTDAQDCANMVNGAISSCGSFIKAAGLRVMP